MEGTGEPEMSMDDYVEFDPYWDRLGVEVDEDEPYYFTQHFYDSGASVMAETQRQHPRPQSRPKARIVTSPSSEKLRVSSPKKVEAKGLGGVLPVGIVVHGVQGVGK